MSLEVVQIKRPREDYPGDEYLIINRTTDKPFEVIFMVEEVALRAAELLDETVVMGDGKRLRKHYYFWKTITSQRRCLDCPSGGVSFGCPRCKGSGQVYVQTEQIDRTDTELEQVQKLIDAEIDELIGFDRRKDCPDKDRPLKSGGFHSGRNGECATCPNLVRDELYDDEGTAVSGKRWQCRKMRDQVKVAETLMGNGGLDGQR